MADRSAENEPKRVSYWKWIGFGAIIVALFVVWRILPMEQWLATFNAWVAGLGMAGMVVYGLFYVVATVLFVPGSIVTIGSGFLFGLGWGTLVVSISATSGASLSFLIARYIARKHVAEKARAYPKFNAIDRAIGQQGGKIVGLLRLSPALPFSLSNYLFGLTAVKFWAYVVATWVGTLPGTVLYVYFGVLGKAGVNAATGTSAPFGSSGQYLLLAVGLIATVVATVFVTRIAKKALKEAAVEGQAQ
ncbi:MAG: TVP38/TMEM64 family protein [bacterium]|nr:TVP38/TMEM64 family protein [bacterium]